MSTSRSATFAKVPALMIPKMNVEEEGAGDSDSQSVSKLVPTFSWLLLQMQLL